MTYTRKTIADPPPSRSRLKCKINKKVCEHESDEPHSVKSSARSAADFVCGFRQQRVPFLTPLHVRL